MAVCADGELLAETGQTSRIVELVAVDAEHPRVAAGIALEECVRVAGSVRAPSLDVAEFALEAPEDVPRAIRRDVVDRVDHIAESRDVADCLLDEDVLVVDEDDPSDLH